MFDCATNQAMRLSFQCYTSHYTEVYASLWNLNYGTEVIKENQRVIKEAEDVVKDVAKETCDVVKAFLSSKSKFANMSEYVNLNRQVC